MSSPTTTSTNSSDELDTSALSPEQYRALLAQRRQLVATLLRESHSSSPAYAHYTWDDYLRLAGGALNIVKPYLRP